MSAAFGYRPELDGLRAVAVSAVIVYHLEQSWLPGGYLGVDIFFVLSGYLITSLLVIEHRSKGGSTSPDSTPAVRDACCQPWFWY